MKYLLDTNTCVDYLRHGSASRVTNKVAVVGGADIALCSVVVAELLYGAWRSSNPAAARTQVLTFCASFKSLAFDDPAAEEYGRLRAHLAGQGTPIGPYDLMIAAIALAHRLTVVTHNTVEFSRVPALVLEDWQ